MGEKKVETGSHAALKGIFHRNHAQFAAAGSHFFKNLGQIVAGVKTGGMTQIIHCGHVGKSAFRAEVGHILRALQRAGRRKDFAPDGPQMFFGQRPRIPGGQTVQDFLFAQGLENASRIMLFGLPHLKAQGGAGILDLSVSADIAKQTFLDGKAPYIVTGPWNTDAFRKAGMDISVLPIPSAGGKEAQPFVGVQAFFPSAKTENGLLVSKFMQYMGTKDVQQKMFDLGGRVPAMTSVAEGISDPDIKGFAEVSGKGVPMPAIPAMSAVWEFWGATEGNIVAGKEAPADGWTAMVSNIENTIKK